VNLWLKSPDLKVLSHMYRSAWHAGLKTTYYLRSMGASGIEKGSIAKKHEFRGVVGESKAETATREGATAEGTQAPFGASATPPTEKKTYTAEEKRVCSIEAMKNGEECEACQ